MKRGLLFMMFLTGLVMAGGTSAHVLVTDGSIGAVMHTDPDDEGIANQPTAFFFEFKDTTGKFKPQNCTCTATLAKDGQIFFSQPLFAKTLDTTGTSAAMSYTFAQSGTYQLVVTGEPLMPDDFSPFTLRYEVEVVAAPQQPITPKSWVGTHVIHLIGAIILTIVTAGMIIYERVRKQPSTGDDKV